jgi:hypothetical protein
LQRLTCRHRKRSDFSGRRVLTFDPHPFSRIRVRPRRRAAMTLRIVLRLKGKSLQLAGATGLH